jgi:hypothetical protein
MDKQEFAALLHAVDQMIRISEPRQAEYYRGYRLGIQFHQLGTLEESIHEHFRLNDSYATSGDHYVDSFARGYRDGCRGLKPSP